MLFALVMVVNNYAYVLDQEMTFETCIAQARDLRANGVDDLRVDLFCEEKK